MWVLPTAVRKREVLRVARADLEDAVGVLANELDSAEGHDLRIDRQAGYLLASASMARPSSPRPWSMTEAARSLNARRRSRCAGLPHRVRGLDQLTAMLCGAGTGDTVILGLISCAR